MHLEVTTREEHLRILLTVTHKISTGLSKSVAAHDPRKQIYLAERYNLFISTKEPLLVLTHISSKLSSFVSKGSSNPAETSV